MKKQLIGLGVAALLFGVVGSAHAVLMQTTWTAKISSVPDTGADAIWDVENDISWTVLFDDQNTVAYYYDDGANGVYDDGLLDDEELAPYNAYNSGYVYYSDAIFDFDTKTNAWMDSLADYNPTVQNTPPDSHSYQWLAGNGQMRTKYYGNGFWLEAIPQYTQTGLMQYYNGAGHTIAFSLKDVTQVTQAYDPVPEPATMLLFGTGLVGLAGSRLRKKRK